MKLIVKKTFRDKIDHSTIYEPGTILEVANSERASDLNGRGLCAEYKGKKAAQITLDDSTDQEESPKGNPNGEIAETGGE